MTIEKAHKAYLTLDLTEGFHIMVYNNVSVYIKAPNSHETLTNFDMKAIF